MDGPKPQAPNAQALDKAIRHLIKMNAQYSRERAFAKITILWQNGELDKVSEERHFKPHQLPKD